MADQENITDEGLEEAKSGKGKLIMMIAGAILLVVIAVAATLLIAGDNDAKNTEVDTESEDSANSSETMDEPDIPPQYIKLDPEFVISYQVGQRQRFLQVSVEILTRYQSVADALVKHKPVIRHHIIQSLGEQKFDQLRTEQGKNTLQKNLREELQTLLKDEFGVKGLEAVLFTGFVMQ